MEEEGFVQLLPQRTGHLAIAAPVVCEVLYPKGEDRVACNYRYVLFAASRIGSGTQETVALLHSENVDNALLEMPRARP